MAPSHPEQFMAHEQKIYKLKAETLQTYKELLSELDEHADWALLVKKAHEAGLEKEDLCRELSCAWSTATRWMAGQTRPGPFARTAIKDKFVKMIEAQQEKQSELADSLAESLEYA